MVRVLIADDDRAIRGLLCDVVSAMGWSFDAVSDGREALESAVSSPPDVIISDVNMGEMSGTDLVRVLHSEHGLWSVPVVLISSLAYEADAIAAGCVAFVAKPFDINELVRVLEEVVSASKVV